jgi:alpha-ketoglutarate-dependent taurine dioxygenase
LKTWSEGELAELSGRFQEVDEGYADGSLLRRKMEGIGDELETGSGAVLLQGLPMETFGEGAKGFENMRELFSAMASQLGTPVSQSAGGDLMLSVRNEAFGKDDSRTRGPNTNRRLSFHTDRCDVIAFLCLRQARKGGENELVSSPALYESIKEERPDLLKILMQPFPYKRHVVDKGNALPYCEQPVFSFCEGHFAGSFLRVLIDRADADPGCPSLSEEQREALDFLEETAERDDLRVRFSQEPGDVLFLNNWVTFHRRTAFEDWPELDRRRHLLRVWLSVPNSRPLDEAFKANYGSVVAGSVRGGMPKEAT